MPLHRTTPRRLTGALVLAACLLPAQSAAARVLVVPSHADSTVRLVETSTNTQVGDPIALGFKPTRAAVSPDGSAAWVTAHPADPSTPGRLIRIDLATRELTAITVGSQPYGVALNPSGTRAYVANFGGTSVSVVDTATRTVVKTISAGLGQVDSVAVTPDGSRLLVSDSQNSSLRLYDSTTDELALAAGPLPLGSSGRRIVVAPDGSAAYVVAQDLGIKRVSLADATVSAAFGPSGAVSLAMAPDGSRLFAGTFGGTVAAFALPGTTASGAPYPLTVKAVPYSVDVDPSGRRLFVFSNGDNDGPGEVKVIDAATGAAIGTPYTLPTTAEDVAAAVVPNQAPSAAFAVAAAFAGEASAFDAGGSSDPDGSVARYDWSFGDGTVLADGGPNPKHVYAQPGSYTVELTVTDDEGASTSKVFTGVNMVQNGLPRAKTTRTVAISARPPAEPVLPGRPADDGKAPTGKTPDRTAPRLTALRLTPAAVRKRTTLSYRLDEAATVTFVVRRAAKGKRSGGECRAAGKGSRRATPCTRWVDVAKAGFTRDSRAGKTSFAPVLPKEAGRYLLVARAKDAAGNTGGEVTAPFRVDAKAK